MITLLWRFLTGRRCRSRRADGLRCVFQAGHSDHVHGAPGGFGYVWWKV